MDPAAEEVLLYTRDRCCLCDQVKQQLRELQKQVPFQVAEVDIDRHAELRQAATTRKCPSSSSTEKKPSSTASIPASFSNACSAGRR